MLHSGGVGAAIDFKNQYDNNDEQQQHGTAVPFCGMGRTKDDSCAREDEALRNGAMMDYYLYNGWATAADKAHCRTARQGLVEFTCANENLWFKDGFGNANVCDIDGDSRVKRGELTNGRDKCQLTTRTYVAVPSLDKGGLLPHTESHLKLGGAQPYSHDRSCAAPLVEVGFDRFVPLVGCLRDRLQNPEHIVPPWVWGGESSRIHGRTCPVRHLQMN
jgi:hypothetical protein